MRTWFYLDADRQPHPAPESHPAGLLLCGTITPDTLVWTEGTTGWQPAGQAMPAQFGGVNCSIPWFGTRRG